MDIEEIDDTIATPPVPTPPSSKIPVKSEGASKLPSKADKAALTGATLAKTMKLEGQSVAQIAQAMGLDTETIWVFLRSQPAITPAHTDAKAS
jgi:hypothetical protein